ncbi:MBP1 [Candida jiufengensis]|uniref:MBP1 n=1 Tax=Candida jiufengensis TaxID=497108 RepID=UPI002224D3B4|nr:MBP1 [Candida jiufengensis]KAI5953462.1 MBP1 [Candida jiufengensis]
MSDTTINNQIYSATYSNVPVFEFVTSEGPLMRRKLDSWINATHILKIAKLPKAKRTRILEKDVQTSTHEKVQGGYGKYQGTYVPLSIGETIAKNFDVYDMLKPIFEFQYIEGKTETPPPAPKHNHASAINVAKRQASLNKKLELKQNKLPKQTKKITLSSSDEPPRKRGRPKGSALSSTPSLQHSDTIPIGNNLMYNSNGVPRLNRQDTEQDNLHNMMASNMNLRQEDLDSVGTDEDDEYDNRNGHKGASLKRHKLNGRQKSLTNGVEYETQNELLTSKELFGVSRNIYEKNAATATLPNQTQQTDLLQPYHQPSINLTQENQIYNEYFGNLLTYFLEDDGKNKSTLITTNAIPEKLLNPPQPISKIHINQPIDQDGNTIFHWACSMGNLNFINFLYDKFQSEIVNDIRNNLGETPLMFLVKFNNCFQLNNFSIILGNLFDTLHKVDSNGKNVLHHIVENKKEKISAYYLDILLQQFIGDTVEKESLNNSDVVLDEEKMNLIANFINHQDSDGNTAFHIAAYHLLKRLIKIFINYHQFINFGLKNLVNATIEHYLASYNFVLRLDQPADDEEPNDNLNEHEMAIHNDDKNNFISNRNDIIEDDSFNTSSFEIQLHNSKLAINLYNNTANLLTEKMTQLSYVINQELNEKDEIVLNFFKTLKVINQIKSETQRTILSFFKLESLIDDLDDNTTNQIQKQPSFKKFAADSQSQTSTHQISSQESNLNNGHDINYETLTLNLKKDHIIQEEIYRLINDLTYQILHQEEKIKVMLQKFDNFREYQLSKELNTRIVKEENVNQQIKQEIDSLNDNDQLQLSIELQNQIIKKKTLIKQIYNKNLESINENQSISLPTTSSSDTRSIISNYSQNDPTNKILKYCKLISLSCGMKIDEIENNIDLIEQSLIMKK